MASKTANDLGQVGGVDMTLVEHEGRLLMGIGDFCSQFFYSERQANRMRKDGRLADAEVLLKGRKVPLLDVGKAVEIMEGNAGLGELRVKKLKEEVLKLKFDREMREKKYVDFDLVLKSTESMARQFAQACEVLPDRLAPQLAVLTEEIEVRRAMIVELDAMRNMIADGLRAGGQAALAETK